jgi:dihydrolipoamide dehydrogenase
MASSLTGDVKLDLAAMQKRRAGDRQDHDGRHHGAVQGERRHRHPGHGRLLPGRQVEVTARRQPKDAQARTWCWPAARCRSSCKSVPHDGKRIVDSWGALEFDAVPKRGSA